MYRKSLQKEPPCRIRYRSNMCEDEGVVDAREQCCSCASAGHRCGRHTWPVLRPDWDLQDWRVLSRYQLPFPWYVIPKYRVECVVYWLLQATMLIAECSAWKRFPFLFVWNYDTRTECIWYEATMNREELHNLTASTLSAQGSMVMRMYGTILRICSTSWLWAWS